MYYLRFPVIEALQVIRSAYFWFRARVWRIGFKSPTCILLAVIISSRYIADTGYLEIADKVMESLCCTADDIHIILIIVIHIRIKGCWKLYSQECSENGVSFSRVIIFFAITQFRPRAESPGQPAKTRIHPFIHLEHETSKRLVSTLNIVYVGIGCKA